MRKRTPIEFAPRQLARPGEAAKVFGVSETKFRSWAKQGKFPLIRPDGAGAKVVFVRLADVQRFIETGVPVTGPEVAKQSEQPTATPA